VEKHICAFLYTFYLFELEGASQEGVGLSQQYVMQLQRFTTPLFCGLWHLKVSVIAYIFTNLLLGYL